VVKILFSTSDSTEELGLISVRLLVLFLTADYVDNTDKERKLPPLISKTTGVGLFFHRGTETRRGFVGQVGCRRRLSKTVVFFWIKTWDSLAGTGIRGVVQGGCKELFFALFLLKPERSEKNPWVL
jgi:hypothetical protein